MASAEKLPGEAECLSQRRLALRDELKGLARAVVAANSSYHECIAEIIMVNGRLRELGVDTTYLEGTPPVADHPAAPSIHLAGVDIVEAVA